MEERARCFRRVSLEGKRDEVVRDRQSRESAQATIEGLPLPPAADVEGYFQSQQG